MLTFLSLSLSLFLSLSLSRSVNTTEVMQPGRVRLTRELHSPAVASPLGQCKVLGMASMESCFLYACAPGLPSFQVATVHLTNMRMHARMHARAHAHTHTRALACTHAHTHTHTHACTHARTHTRTHAHTHARTHARTHTHTHAHTHRVVQGEVKREGYILLQQAVRVHATSDSRETRKCPSNCLGAQWIAICIVVWVHPLLFGCTHCCLGAPWCTMPIHSAPKPFVA